jgi:hypothetical protein
MADLVATKRVTYAGRVYRPGVGFSVTSAHAHVLVAAGMARSVTADVMAPRNTIEAMRAEYQAKAGRSPDKRWGAARLAKEIAAL